MWICCITVHIVIDQIFDKGLFFSPGSVENLNIILGKNAWKFLFCLKPLSCEFWHRGGGCMNITLLTVKRVGKDFSTRRVFVAVLLEECYRMCYRRLLKRYDEAFEACVYMHWSLCCVSVRVCVCLWACDLVITSQFNLLTIYVHPALPPAPAPPPPPQA